MIKIAVALVAVLGGEDAAWSKSAKGTKEKP